MEFSTPEEIWRKDFDKHATALKPWVFEMDGDLFIDPSAPEGLTEPYQDLVSFGYAKGWL